MKLNLNQPKKTTKKPILEEKDFTMDGSNEKMTFETVDDEVAHVDGVSEEPADPQDTLHQWIRPEDMPAEEVLDDPEPEPKDPIYWVPPVRQEFDPQYSQELVSIGEFTPMNVLSAVYSEIDTDENTIPWYENYEEVLMQNMGALTRTPGFGSYYVSFVDTEGTTPALTYAAAQTIAHELVTKYQWASAFIAVVDKATAVKQGALSPSYGTEGIVLYFVLFPFDHPEHGFSDKDELISPDQFIADYILECEVVRMVSAVDGTTTNVHDFDPERFEGAENK